MATDTAKRNSTNDTTKISAGCQLDNSLVPLETDALALSQWSLESFLKLNLGKYRLLTFGTNQGDTRIKVGEAIVE